RQGPAIIGVGAGQLGLAIAPAVIGLAVHRDVVHLRADAGLAQRPHELPARRAESGEIDEHGIEMPDGESVRAARDGPDEGRELGGAPVVLRGERPARLGETVELFELAQGKRRVDVAEAVIEPDLRHLVVPGIGHRALEGGRLIGEFRGLPPDAVAAPAAQALGARRIPGHDRTTFAGGDSLYGMEGEDGEIAVAARPDGMERSVAAPERAADGVAGILDDLEAVPPGKSGEAAEIAALPAEMH